MPEIDLSTYANMDANTLEFRRRALITKAAGDHDNLAIEELHELAAIMGVLRRKASGPPKTAKTKSVTGGTRRSGKATADDLA